MNPKTEQLLYGLLWTCDMLSRPTWRNLTDSFEGWAYRSGFLRQLQRLEKRQFLDRRVDRSGNRVHRLTEAGRLHALGGRDPGAHWKRHWDGRWRLVLFDVPRTRNATRDKLRRYLRNRGFGCLQNSVWITPDPVNEERNLLSGEPVDVESLILFEARPCAGESDEGIVAGAWNFAEINSRYASHLQLLKKCPCRHLKTKEAVMTFRRWLGEEREAWMNAISRDPLLPEPLLPRTYFGQESWRMRLEVMGEAGQQMRQCLDS
jgi:phenylacetic acid degradation operon negative regulatory protein